MLKRCFLLLMTLGAAFGAFPAETDMKVSSREVTDALRTLDDVLDSRDLYVGRRSARLDSLNRNIDELPRRDPRRLDLLMSLADCYTGYLTDSAIINYRRGEELAQRLNDDVMAMKFKLKATSVMPLTGFGATAVETYESLDIDSMKGDLKVVALEAGRQLYSYQASFFDNYRDEYDRWNDKAVESQRQLLELLPEGTPKFALNTGEYYFLTGKPSEARAVLLELLDSVPGDSNIAARAAHILSSLAKNRGDNDAHLYYLTMSAIADLKSATREMVSLQELGIALYARGDTERAYECLSVALAYAVECNAAMRMLQTSEALPVIEAAHRDTVALSRRRLNIVIGVMALSLLAVLTMLVKLRKKMRQMSQLQEVLAGANRVKEMYMSQFLNLCTTYMSKLNQFCKIASRKISTGHVDDLYKLTNSGRFVEEQSREFYDTFDKAFLHIYPDFVDEVNRLLKPDERIELKEDEVLNTDLRILAFMRLGVEESTRIAQVLNYSVHTIYSYRNRLRNRAVDRENFEADVMKIGSL